MADKVEDVRKAIESGRHEVADTRSAITEKLTVLEQRVQNTVNGVKQNFDLHYHVNQRPWLMFGGSLLVGYAFGRGGGESRATADTSSEPSAHAQPRQSIVSEVSQVKNDFASVKGAAFGAVISTLWAMAKQVLLPPVRQSDAGLTRPDAQPKVSPQITNRFVNSKHNGRSEV